MWFEDLRKGDRFWWVDGNGMEYRKDNDEEARCVEKGSSYFGCTEMIKATDRVKYNIATENE